MRVVGKKSALSIPYQVLLRRSLALVAAGLLLAAPVSGFAMTELPEDDLSNVSGEGIAMALENFRFQMAPTSFIEQVGTATKYNCPTVGCTSPGGYLDPNNANYLSFMRGDLRWYGLSLTATGDSNAFGFDGSACTGWTCPIGPNVGMVAASYTNPYVMRVFDYTAYNYQNASVSRTVLELLGPSKTERYRWAFWGENIVDGGTSKLQSQAIINGNPTAPAQFAVTSTKAAADALTQFGPVLQLFRTANSSDQTLGLLYHSRLRGDFRFSLGQTGTTATGVPIFNNGTSAADAPGLKYRNVNAYMPLGQLHYQSIVLDDTVAGNGGSVGNGNFVIELTKIPNQTNVIADFYSLPTAGCTAYAGATAAQNCGYVRTSRPARYSVTHGYVFWGTNDGTLNNNATVATARADATDGIMFTAPSGASNQFTASASRPYSTANVNGESYTAASLSHVNIGDSYIEGMLIQHLKITSLGAGP